MLNLGFHRLLIVAFVAIILFISFISVGTSIYFEMKETKAYQNQLGVQIAARISRSIILPMLAENREEVQRILKGFFPEKGLLAIAILPEKGSLILTKDEKDSRTFSEIYSIMKNASQEILEKDLHQVGKSTLIIKNILLPGSENQGDLADTGLGKITVVLSNEPFRQEMWSRVGVYGVLLTLYLIGGAGIAMFITNLVTKRLNALEKSVRAFAAVDSDVGLPASKGNDAISSLAGSFEKMKKDLSLRTQALIRSMEQWEATFDAINEPIFLVDKFGQFLNANETLLKMLEMKKGELIGKNCYDHLSIPRPIDLAGKDKRFAMEIPALKIHGDVTAFHARHFDYWVYFIRDVTQNLFLQKQLTESQKFESMGTMAAGTAHEFNNILQTILGYASLLKMTGETEKWGEKQMDGLNKIMMSVSRATNITNNLLSMTRKKEKDTIVADLVPVIKERVKVCQQTFGPSIKIVSAVDKALWTVNCSPTEIDQVLVNLMINANHAMEEEGGTITVEAKNVELPEAHSVSKDLKPGKYALIKVVDTGCGISTENIEKIFEPFFTTKSVGKGTGLGLSTSLGIIQSYGGTILVESEKGKGSTFSIYLPADITKKVAQELKEPMPIRGKLNILILEDEEIIRAEMANHLSYLGYDVQTAGNGAEALEMIFSGKYRFDIIILDILLPVMDGERFLEALRKTGSKIPVVVLTGFAESDKIRKIRGLGVKDVLYKPSSISAITHAIHGIPYKKSPRMATS